MNWIAVGFDSLYNQPSWYIGSALTSCYILYYLFEVVKKPIIATSPKGKFYEFVDRKLPILKDKFWPTLWCIESRAQTVIATFVRVSIFPSVAYKREILTLKDGGQVCLDTLDPSEDCPPSNPTVLILPGLTGGSQSDYVKGLALTAKNNGLRSVVFSQRGIGGISLKTPRTYCACNTEDLVEVIDHLKKKLEGATIAAVGISMGGLILGSYLASEEGAKRAVSAGMLISVPWDLEVGSRSIEQPGLNLMLNKHLASALCRIVQSTKDVLGQLFPLEDVLKSRTIREFDSRFTVKQFGFRDVEEYYRAASLHNKLDRFKVPVLCLNAADDPFQPLNGIPLEEASLLEDVCLVVTSRGGHIGFMEGLCPTFRDQYMFRLFGQFFRAILIDGELQHFQQ